MSQTSREDIAGVVIKHLVDINSGRCTITPEQIADLEHDRHLSEMLTGLLCLHEDLQLRDEQRKRAEVELMGLVARLEEQNRELEESRAAMAALAAELATPIIKVWKGVLMMPLVGSVDGTRAAEIMHRLLNEVVKEKAHYTILDLTGVEVIDSETADHFVRILGAVQLLGATGIVAGVQPSVSLAMVSLGVDLSGIVTVRNVQEGLVHCMGQSRPQR